MSTLPNKPDINKVQPDRDLDVTAHGIDEAGEPVEPTETQAPEPPEDTEGHRFYSDANIKHKIEQLDDDVQAHADDAEEAEGPDDADGEDAEGHRYWSDASIKHDIRPLD